MSQSTPSSGGYSAAPLTPRPKWLFDFLGWAKDGLWSVPFWGYAVVAAVALGAFDWEYLRKVDALVAATVILAEATAFLALASFYNGQEQKLANERLTEVVARWLESEADRRVSAQPNAVDAVPAISPSQPAVAPSTGGDGHTSGTTRT